MADLPVVSGEEAAGTFVKDGWRRVRRAKSSHIYLEKPNVRAKLSIPDHDTLDRGLLRKLIRLAGLTVDRFVELLDA